MRAHVASLTEIGDSAFLHPRLDFAHRKPGGIFVDPPEQSELRMRMALSEQSRRFDELANSLLA